MSTNAKPSFGLVYTVDADMRRKEQERAMEQDWRKKRLNIAETPPPHVPSHMSVLKFNRWGGVAVAIHVVDCIRPTRLAISGILSEHRGHCDLREWHAVAGRLR